MNRALALSNLNVTLEEQVYLSASRRANRMKVPVHDGVRVWLASLLKLHKITKRGKEICPAQSSLLNDLLDTDLDHPSHKAPDAPGNPDLSHQAPRRTYLCLLNRSSIPMVSSLFSSARGER